MSRKIYIKKKVIRYKLENIINPYYLFKFLDYIDFFLLILISQLITLFNYI